MGINIKTSGTHHVALRSTDLERAKNPSHDGGMNDPGAALHHQGAYVAVAQLIINVPADGLDDE